MILVYITNPDEETAKKVSKHLLEKKLIACSNIFPIKSMYWWEGKIEDDHEVIALIKTREENYVTIVQEVEKIHPYDTPCIIRIKAEANKSYQQWLEREISN
jgi:periplasmic divalent cation tolerance protein